MRPIPRTVAGLVLAGSLIFPAVEITQAAPAGPGTHRAILAINLTYAASVEGVTPQVLQQDLQAGQTLLQIAQTAHSTYATSAGTLATALLAQDKSRLDRAVTAGRVSQAQENQRYSALLSSMTAAVTTPHPSVRFSGIGGQSGTRAQTGSPTPGLRGRGILARGPLLTTLASTCNTTSSALRTAIRAGGKSLLAICQSTNSSVTETDLATAIVNAYKTRLDAGVKAGRITASQESQVLSGLQTRIHALITTPLPARGTAASA